MPPKRKRVRNIGNVKKRHQGLYEVEVSNSRDIESLLGILALLLLTATDLQIQHLYLTLITLFAVELDDIYRDTRFISEPIERMFLRFDTQSPNTFTINYRFRKEHILRLAGCLRIPPEFCLENGVWVNGQEALLITLRKLSFPLRFIDLENFAGWELSRLCRIFKFTMDFIFLHHSFRVTEMTDRTMGLLEASRLALQLKKRSLHPDGHLYERTQSVCQYFDGFRVSICRPLDFIPIDEVDVDFPPHIDIQALVYSGHKKESQY